MFETSGSTKTCAFLNKCNNSTDLFRRAARAKIGPAHGCLQSLSGC